MGVHDFGDFVVDVDKLNNWYFLYREQGITVKVYRWAATRPWWAFGALVNTRVDEAIELNCTIVMTGLDAAVTASNACGACSSLRVIGAWYTGLNVPRGYDGVSYRGVAVRDGRRLEFSGDFLWA